ncbi:unnamed protein product, partial [Laminaria digitata]
MEWEQDDRGMASFRHSTRCCLLLRMKYTYIFCCLLLYVLYPSTHPLPYCTYPPTHGGAGYALKYLVFVVFFITNKKYINCEFSRSVGTQICKVCTPPTCNGGCCL